MAIPYLIFRFRHKPVVSMQISALFISIRLIHSENPNCCPHLG